MGLRLDFHTQLKQTVVMNVWNEVIQRWTDLTNWGLDKKADIQQPTFSNEFSWMEMYEFYEVSLKYVPKVRINS